MKNFHNKTRLLAALSVALLFACDAHAAAEDIYKGKTVNILVGYAPGGARHGAARIWEILK